METVNISSGNTVLQAKIYNIDTDETVILLHGGPGVPDYLEDLAFFLSNHFRIITFDQRGVGQSRMTDRAYSVKDYIADINNISEYFTLKEFHVFGHSWGGLLAQLYAIEYPEKVISMFLCNPFPGVGQHWLFMEKDITNFARLLVSSKKWIKLLYNYMAAQRGAERADKAMRRIIVLLWESYVKRQGLSMIKSKYSLKGINAKALLKTRASIIKLPASILEGQPILNNIPILVCFGKNDIFLQTKWITRARYPRAQYVEISGTGHFPWLEEEDNFNRILLQFYDMKQ